MIKATIILGEDAVKRYKDVGKVPSRGWLRRNKGKGVVDERFFETKDEYDTYSGALKDMRGWSEGIILDPEPTTELNAYKKELHVFVFPTNRFERNATDEELLADAENYDGSDRIEVYTPDEFAAMLNDDDAGFSRHWVRFIMI